MTRARPARTTPARRPPASTAGFTLVEVLVVVAIIAIAAAVVVPAINEQGQMGVQAASRIVITDLLYAQNEAIAQQKPRRVVFDAQNNQYAVTDENGTVLSVPWKGGSAGPNYLIDFENDRRFSGVSIATVNLNDQGYVEFDALGAPDAGGYVELASKHTRYRVSVAPITGRVTIQAQ